MLGSCENAGNPFPAKVLVPMEGAFRGKRPDSPQHSNPAETQLLVLNGLLWKAKHS